MNKERPEIPESILKLSLEELDKRIDGIEGAIITNRGVGLSFPELEERLINIRNIYLRAREVISKQTQNET